MSQRDNDEGVEMVGVVIRTTEKAFLLRLRDNTEEWIPFSQADGVERDVVQGSRVSFTISTWLAEQKGWA